MRRGNGALIAEQLPVLLRGTESIITQSELDLKLEMSIANGRPLRVKFGADPTSSDLHLGHAVALLKLRDFQEMGHHVIFLLGDFTAQIGDPSGRNLARPFVDRDLIEEHAKTYLEQVYKILDSQKTEVRRNSEWLDQMVARLFITRLMSEFTFGRLAEREEFRNRLTTDKSPSLAEFMYPLIQAYDSVVLGADVEIGGADQLFNFHIARQVQRTFGQEPEVGVTVPLLVGLDGSQKMSKSLNNSVGVNDAVETIAEKLRSLPKDLIPTYFKLATRLPETSVAEITQQLDSGQMSADEARDVLTSAIIGQYHLAGPQN